MVSCQHHSRGPLEPLKKWDSLPNVRPLTGKSWHSDKVSRLATGQSRARARREFRHTGWGCYGANLVGWDQLPKGSSVRLFKAEKQASCTVQGTKMGQIFGMDFQYDGSKIALDSGLVQDDLPSHPETWQSNQKLHLWRAIPMPSLHLFLQVWRGWESFQERIICGKLMNRPSL